MAKKSTLLHYTVRLHYTFKISFSNENEAYDSEKEDWLEDWTRSENIKKNFEIERNVKVEKSWLKKHLKVELW